MDAGLSGSDQILKQLDQASIDAGALQTKLKEAMRNTLATLEAKELENNKLSEQLNSKTEELDALQGRYNELVNTYEDLVAELHIVTNNASDKRRKLGHVTYLDHPETSGSNWVSNSAQINVNSQESPMSPTSVKQESW